MNSAFTLALIAATAVAAPLADKMTDLPDAPAFLTNMYSGYLDVTDTKALHYAFAES